MIDQRVRQKFEDLKKQYPGSVPTISFLRHEQVLKDNKSIYEFDFNSRNDALESERRLSDKDVFLALDMGLYLIAEKDAEPGSGQLLSYPAAAQFPDVATDATAGTKGFKRAHLEVVYNGKMSVNVQNNIVFEALDTRRFRKQNSAASEQGYNDGLVNLEPYIVLNGKNKNKVVVQIPTFGGILIESSTAGVEHRLVAYAVGILIPGANA
jgi:hypothetical protein